MGLGRTAYSACETRRPSADDRHARGDERNPVSSRNGLSVPDLANGFSAATREQAGKEASPTAAIIDSQSVKGAEKGGRGSTRRAMTRGRKSKERSDISWSTRSASR